MRLYIFRQTNRYRGLGIEAAIRPLRSIGLRVKIRDAESRQVKNKAVYVALGVTPEGEREVLGLWIAANEGAFWLSVMNNLRNRGVEDILIAVVDDPNMDLSRFDAAPSARLSHFPFECDGAFPAQR